LRRRSEMEPVTTKTIIAVVIFVVVNTLGFWVREWLKHRTWNKNGNALKEIKTDIKSTHTKIDCVDKKVGETKVKIAEVKTAVDAQKTQCAATVKRFDKTISEQNQTIIGLAKNSGKKR